jgi:hypothetical protein
MIISVSELQPAIQTEAEFLSAKHFGPTRKEAKMKRDFFFLFWKKRKSENIGLCKVNGIT